MIASMIPEPPFNSLFEMRQSARRAMTAEAIVRPFNSLFEMPRVAPPQAPLQVAVSFNSLFEMRHKSRRLSEYERRGYFQFSI